MLMSSIPKCVRFLQYYEKYKLGLLLPLLITHIRVNGVAGAEEVNYLYTKK
jgi:hypothetical protein